MAKSIAEFWYAIQTQREGILRINEIHVDPYAGLASPPDDPGAYRASLRRIVKLSVEFVYPGHWGRFDGARMTGLNDEQLAGLERCR